MPFGGWKPWSYSNATDIINQLLKVKIVYLGKFSSTF